MPLFGGNIYAHKILIVYNSLDETDGVFCDGEIGATPTAVGERRGLTGETATDRGTGDEERGVEPVGVVLPLAFF